MQPSCVCVKQADQVRRVRNDSDPERMELRSSSERGRFPTAAPNSPHDRNVEIKMMATYKVHYNESAAERPSTDSCKQHRPVGSTPVLLIAAYFLALASVAVIGIGGQFPWFTAAPATVLSLIAYFRHLDAKMERESSSL